MKKFNIFFFFLALAVVFGCQPEEVKPIGEPADKKALLAGSWQLSQVVQQDEIAIVKSFPEHASRMDITNAFPDHPFTDLEITFKADGTFSIVKGEALVNLPEAGQWAFDHEQYVSSVILTDADGNETVVEFGSLNELGQGHMALTNIRRDESGKPYLSYIYSFTKN